MNNAPDPDLVKITEVFLIPSSFLVAALGTADTNIHRAAVSVIGLVVSLMWWSSSWEALAERVPTMTEATKTPHSRRIRIMGWLPVFFVLCWIVSVVAHALLWNHALGHYANT
jgi:hypothetical protein